jgi:hypothetical protein
LLPRAELLAEAYLGAARSLANWWLDHPELSADAIADQLMHFARDGLTGGRDSGSRYSSGAFPP